MSESDDGSGSIGRRDLLRSAGTAGAVGAGLAASSGTVAAQNCEDPVWARDTSLLSCMEYVIGEGADTAAAPFLFAAGTVSAQFNEDPTRDRITLHNQCTGAEAWWNAALDMIRDDRLQDAAMSADVKARDAIVDAWEAGKTQSEARDAALSAMSDFLSTPARNATETFASALAEIGYAAEAARADSDIGDRFVGFTIADNDYAGTGAVVESGSRVNSDHVTHEVELPNGEMYAVDAPDLSHEWDNGDTITITLGDVQSGYDATNEEVVLTTADGNEVTSNLPIVVPNVPDTDLKSETVLLLEEFAAVMDEIHTIDTTVRGNYDTTLVGKLYSALDSGDLDPSDVRGISGLATHLSGTSDVTSDRFQMALLMTTGLSRADLSKVSSMSVEYTGYTEADIERDDGAIVGYNLSGEVDAKSYQGQLFAHGLPTDGLQQGTTYATQSSNRAAAIDKNGRLSVVDAATEQELWAVSLASDVANAATLSPDGSIVVAATGQNAIAFSTDTGEELWATGSSATDVEFSYDGQTVYVSGSSLLSLDPQTGEQNWSTSSSYEDLSITADGTVYAISGSQLHKLNSNGEPEWSEDVGYALIHMAVAPDGSVAVVGGEYQTNGFTALDLENDRTQLWNEGITAVTNGVEIGPESKTAYCVADNTTVYAFDLQSGEQNWTTTPQDDPNDIAVSRDGSYVFHGDSYNSIYALDAETGDQSWAVGMNGTVNAVGAPGPASQIGGFVESPLFFDAPAGEEVSFKRGTFEIVEMTDSEGNTLDKDASVNWGEPDHDATDMTVYRTYVEETSEEHKDAIKAEESAGVPSVQNPFSGGGPGLLLLAAAAAAAAIGLNNN